MARRTRHVIWVALAMGSLGALASAQEWIVAAGESTNLASAATGSYFDTQLPYDAVETITEGESGGKPSKRTSQLEQIWYFQVPAAPTATLLVRAARTDSGEGDDFAFSWSNNQGQFFFDTGFAVSDTTMPAQPVEVVLPAAATGGTLWLRVRDTDRTAGNRALDTLTVDFLAVVVGQVGPPAAPATAGADGKSAGTIVVEWSDVDVEDGYRIERSPTGAETWQIAGSVGSDEWWFVDEGLPPSTAYDYRVVAFNPQGDSAPSDTCTAATRDFTDFAAEILTADGANFYDLAIDGAGTVGVGYGGGLGLHYAERDPSTGTWTDTIVAPGSAPGGAFAFAPDGAPAFAYATNVSGEDEVRLAERRGGQWYFTVVDDSVWQGVALALAHDPSDPAGQDLAIAYRKYSKKRDIGFHVARRIAGQWTVEQVVTDLEYGLARPSLAFTQAGELLFTYRSKRYDGTSSWISGVYLVRHDGARWLSPVAVVEYEGVHVEYPDLAVDPVTGHPVVAFAPDWRSSELRLARFDGTQWSTEQIVVNPNGGLAAHSLCYGAFPCIAYVRVDEGSAVSGIYLSRWNGATWQEELVDDLGSEGSGEPVGLGVDAQGRVAACYGSALTPALLSGRLMVALEPGL